MNKIAKIFKRAKKMKVLITGSNGVIGRVLMDQPAKDFDFFGVDILADPDHNVFKADLSDYKEAEQVVERVQPLDCIVHLAGDSNLEASWESVLKNNIIATRNVYEVSKRCGVKRIVFASSSHVTGAYEGIPPKLHEKTGFDLITVGDPIRPDSDYGTSKVFGESIARQYFERFGIESICLRIGLVLQNDRPVYSERARCIWLSHRDLVQLVRKSILADVKFGIYYGVSNNKKTFWDITNAREELGYEPVDDSSEIDG